MKDDVGPPCIRVRLRDIEVAVMIPLHRLQLVRQVVRDIPFSLIGRRREVPEVTLMRKQICDCLLYQLFDLVEIHWRPTTSTSFRVACGCP